MPNLQTLAFARLLAATRIRPASAAKAADAASVAEAPSPIGNSPGSPAADRPASQTGGAGNRRRLPSLRWPFT